ncbi:MAG: phosphate ABC transporter permease PstA [Oscillospiraceae bacterium]|nr:phosphate ABC transporter permease PstA [Oscillospiraceae bacterium]
MREKVKLKTTNSKNAKTGNNNDVGIISQKLPFKRRFHGYIMKGFIFFCVAFAVSLILFLIGYIFYRGLPHVTFSMLTSTPSLLRGTVGILPNLLYTVYIIFTTLIISLPIGIGAAVYLNEYATNRRLVRIIEFTIETLAGIPSIIYGLVGFLIFVRMMGGATILSGSMTLSILVLPTVVRTTQEALKTVPISYREGSVALGATKWYSIRTIILPSSLDGIVSGVILAIGRMVAESAALLFTAGAGHALITNYFAALQTGGRPLTVALYFYATEPGQWGDVSSTDVAFAIAAVLIIIVLVLNFLTKLLKRKLKKI